MPRLAILLRTQEPVTATKDHPLAVRSTCDRPEIGSGEKRSGVYVGPE